MDVLDDGLRINLEIRMYRETFLMVERALLQRKMTKYLRLNKSVVIACVECSDQAATLFCQDCGDHYCTYCNITLHKSSSAYQKHTTRDISFSALGKKSQTQFPPVKGQTSVWRKFEYFNFPLSPHNPQLFK